MNSSLIYQEAVKVKSPEEILEKERKKSEDFFKDSQRESQREEWLENGITKLFLLFLEKTYKEQIELALSNSTKSGERLAEVLRALLIEANTLRKVINYVRTGKYE